MTWRTAASDGLSYDELPSETLQALVTSATGCGCGISFSRTKDRVALVITVFAGDSGKETTFARSLGDVSVLLSDMQTEEFKRWARSHQPV